MTGPPPYIASRRATARARRRRRRRATLAGCAALAVALLAVVLIVDGSGATRGGRDAPAATTGQSASIASRGSHRAETATATAAASRATAEIKRLIALGRPIYCAGPHGNEVAFTFDDGPGVYTYIAVKKLRQAHERATFFVVGRNIDPFPGWLPKELALGAIGDHTWTHPELIELSPSEIYTQLAQTAHRIQAVSGEHVELWRPPYELHDATTDRIARRLGLLEILWSVDSADSLGANYAGIIHNVEAGLRPGAIVLMHENHGQTIRALTTLLPELRRRHLRSVSVPELLASDPPSSRQVLEGGLGCGVKQPLAGSGS
ncbi:MAG: polysaccharide deacetylase family protein [Solirubrobacteraceae bacterium]|jgi:peptidoglycan/xylan/chitin deacetylase (PgdA/CDA1 family)